MVINKHLLFSLFSLALIFCLTACFSANNSSAVMAQPLPEAGTALPLEPTINVTADIPVHPLSITALRSRSYDGGDFVAEQTLDPGSNYNRYIVSYLSEGLKIYALLTIPWAEKPATGYPVVIFNHGYIPPEQYRTTERYLAYTDAFARSGYIVVKSDYRGHGSSEGDAESAYGNPGYTIDVLNALAAARRYPDADPNRIGMWGHSMGGYITLRAMVAEQGIKAGVIWAGVVASYDYMFQSWFNRRGGGTPRPGWRSTMMEQYGTPAENPDFWYTLSANNFLADLSGPVQIHHGTGDTTVPVAYSTTLDAQIREAGMPVELFLYEGDDHNIAGNRDDALTLSVVFFDQHVKNSKE
jgi:uncharacterized protein